MLGEREPVHQAPNTSKRILVPRREVHHPLTRNGHRTTQVRGNGAAGTDWDNDSNGTFAKVIVDQLHVSRIEDARLPSHHRDVYPGGIVIEEVSHDPCIRNACTPHLVS